jgi:hypothetical protein
MDLQLQVDKNGISLAVSRGRPLRGDTGDDSRISGCGVDRERKAKMLFRTVILQIFSFLTKSRTTCKLGRLF